MKTNILFTLVIFSIFIIPARSQNSLTGKVSDMKTGKAITGATVYISDLKSGAVTDTAGFYKIENLPKTKVLVQVNFLGYKTIALTVDLKTTSSMNFAMESTVTEMNEVVVTGSSNATEIKKDPVPIISIDLKYIEQNQSLNIIDAIAKLPGVSAVTTGPNVSKPFIHGLGYNRVLTLYDGLRQEGQQWGDEHGEEIDGYAIDNIEVIKGPASLIYGSDALAGVVNLLTSPPVENGVTKGSLLMEYQTNNVMIGNSVNIASNKNGFNWSGRISHKQAKDYMDKIDGRVYGTAYDETDVSGDVGLNKKWGFTHLDFSIYNNLLEIPDGSRDSTTRKFTKQITEADTFRPIVSDKELNTYDITTLHQHVQHYRIYSSNNFIIGEGKLGVNLGFQQNIRREFSHPQAADVAGLYLVLNSFIYDASYSFPEMKGWDLTAGSNGMYQINKNKGSEFIIPDYNQFDIGPFAHIKKSFKKLDVSAGLRYDTRFFTNDQMFTHTDPATGFDMQVSPPDTIGASKEFSNFKHTFSGVSGSIGVSYDLSKKFILKANVAQGFRAPNISEISANGVHPGTNMYQVGNSAIKPEQSLQEDLGIFFNSKYVTGSIETFYNIINNYIFNQKLLNHLGHDSIIVQGNQTFKFLQSQAELYGGEANLDIHPHPLDWLHFENSVSVIYAMNKGGNGVIINDSSKYLPLIPPMHFHSELRAENKKKFHRFSAAYIKVEMDHYATQNRVYLADNTETPTTGYTLFNIGAGSDIINKTGKVVLKVNLTIDNIADVAYQSHLSRLKYFEQYPVNWSGHSGIYNMGRNAGVKVIIPFS